MNVLTYEQLKQQFDDVVAESVALKETLEYIVDGSNQPDYHYQGMGCGLEDKDITDRYEAMHHGWECAIERVYSEVIPNAMPEIPATDAALAEVEARGVDKAIACITILLNHENPDVAQVINSLQNYTKSLREVAPNGN